MILGLTGSFGCGKSSALTCFRNAGWQTLNTDDICAELYERRDAGLTNELRTRWQDKVFHSDGRVNKAAIAEIVFSDRAELQWLCSVLYPLIAENIRETLERHPGKDFIIEVPLLFESGWDEMCDKTVCVWTDPDTQKARLLKKGFTADDIDRRNSRQLPNDRKLEKADFGLINNGSLQFLKEQCNNLINHIKEQK
ncbi:MAG: dephospho-CoA kinase [Victivallaceae bacterium]|nr:dephospho-CoA kinase [Victivallaceae bacterium]